MKILSLFDGISCGKIAAARAGINVEIYCASEIDRYAEAVSRYNWPEIVRLGDVRGWRDWNIVKPDLLIGGSPCQDLSVAGSRAGLEGEQSRLFFEFNNILKYYKPRYFLLENVASMGQISKNRISELLGVDPIKIDSSLVSAQQRRRLFWTNISNITQPENRHIYLKDILEKVDRDKSYCIDASYYKGSSSDYFHHCRRQMVFNHASDKPIRVGLINNKNWQGNRVYAVCGKAVSLKANGGGFGACTGLYQINLPDGKYCVRKLTPVECERLQTIPDRYTALGLFPGTDKPTPISNTQRYKTLGNGWTVEVISHILSFITDKK